MAIDMRRSRGSTSRLNEAAATAMASRAERGGETEWEIPDCDHDKMQRRCRLTKGRRNAYPDRTCNRLRGRPY